MAEKKKASHPVEEKPTKVKGTFLEVFKVVKDNKLQNSRKGHYSLPIEEMELPIRLQILLRNNEITTLKQLASFHLEELMQIKGMGIKYISLLEDVVAKYGLRFGDFIR